jgi:hypothetical protein
MTWLRWDTDTPQSDVVGHLAEALGVGIPSALGHYLACCMSFGAHRPDGHASEVSDLTLEQWGLWTGKRGRFAAAFRARCVDDNGIVRGWWRQSKLLAHQEAKRKRPSQSQRVRQQSGDEIVPGPAEVRRRTIAGNEDGTLRNGKAVYQSGGATARLLAVLGTDPHRFTVMALFDHLPPTHNPEAWAGLLADCLQGGMAQGRAASVQDLAAVCAEYPAIEHCPWSPAHFRASLERVARRGARPASGKADRAIAVVQAWTTAEPAA